MTAARPFLVPGATAIEWVRSRAVIALDGWARQWIVRYADDPTREAAVRVVAAVDGPRSLAHEYEAVNSAAGCLWIRSTHAERWTVSAGVVGAELLPRSACADDWVAGVVESAWQARNRELVAALLGPVRDAGAAAGRIALPATVLAPGSGAVFIECEELGLSAFADAAAWREAPRADGGAGEQLAPLVPVTQAMHGATASIEVILGSAEVEVPKVLDLRSGDVLRLSQRLADGIAVLCEGRPLAQAALGQTDGRVSVQLMAIHS